MIANVSNISQIQNIQQAAIQQKLQEAANQTKQDRLELSKEAQELMKQAEAEKAKPTGSPQQATEAQSTQAAQSGEAAQNAQTQAKDNNNNNNKDELAQENNDEPEEKSTAQLNIELTDEQKQMLTKLKARDKEVRTHEQAHVSAGGGLTGKPEYSEQRGPDGKMYAVGGTVEIDTSPAETPEKTIKKAQTIKAAALAPAEPSAEDRRIAAYAEQMEAAARIEIEEAKKQQAELNGEKPGFFEKIFSGISFYA